MLLNTIFNTISVIYWRSAVLVEDPEKAMTCRKSLTNFITLCCTLIAEIVVNPTNIRSPPQWPQIHIESGVNITMYLSFR